jgi:hypothetical protein
MTCARWARSPSPRCATPAATSRSTCSATAWASLPRGQEARPGRLGRGHRTSVRHQDRRAHRRRRGVASAGEVAAAAARQVPRPQPTRRRATASAHLDLMVNPEVRRAFRAAQPRDRLHPALARRARLPRGRDAGAAGDPGRRRGAAVRDPPQRARPRLPPADQPRALPQAADRRRVRRRLRDRPQLPQRGHQLQAQPRVHDARALLGREGLPRHPGAGRGPVREAGAGTHRQHAAPVPGELLDFTPPWPRVDYTGELRPGPASASTCSTSPAARLGWRSATRAAAPAAGGTCRSPSSRSTSCSPSSTTSTSSRSWCSRRS